MESRQTIRPSRQPLATSYVVSNLVNRYGQLKDREAGSRRHRKKSLGFLRILADANDHPESLQLAPSKGTRSFRDHAARSSHFHVKQQPRSPVFGLRLRFYQNKG